MRKEILKNSTGTSLPHNIMYKMLFVVFTIFSVYLFYNLYHIIFAVHDDMLMYLFTRTDCISSESLKAAKEGRLPQIWDYYLLSFPFLLNKVWFYKAVAFSSLLFDTWAMWFFLAKHIQKSFAYVCAILFLAFATISPNHNLFIAYAFCHQIPIGLFFLSLHGFVDYHKSRKKRSIVLCCLCYLLSCMIYETFLMYMLVFIVMACVLQKNAEASFYRFICKVFWSILPPLTMATFYTVIYKTWQLFYPPFYGGILLYLDEPVYSLKTIFDYSVSLFPINAVANISQNDPVGFPKLWQSLTIGSVVKSVIITTATLLIIHTYAPKKKLHGYLWVFFTGLFAPNILMGFSQKYVTSAKNGNTSYIPSFYSYMFLIIFLFGFLWLLYHLIKNRNLRILYLGIVGCSIFGLSILADYNVDYWKSHYETADRRYRNFDKCLSSQLVTDCDEHWQIYAPDNAGIHAREDFNLRYLSIYDDTPVSRFIRNYDDIETDKAIMCMRSDENYNLMTVGKADENCLSDTIMIVTVVPKTFNVVLKTASGTEIQFDEVSDGSIIHSPQDDLFDMHNRIRIR